MFKPRAVSITITTGWHSTRLKHSFTAVGASLQVPFQLSPSFRPMLQRGIELPALDVTYFTSLSFYILLLFGLRGVFMLVFRYASPARAGVLHDESLHLRDTQTI